MKILGIESSCDETAAAVVTADGEVLSDVVASQVQLHSPYGGVVPELASRAHLRSIVPVIHEALRALPKGLSEVDAIAVTHGPGLVGALLVGVQVAKALAWSRGIPLIGVDHLHGHLLSVFLQHAQTPALPKPEFPFVALLVSGGHTALYLVSASEYSLLGQTRDDAAGEAFDKMSKLLGLGYPGGPVIDRLAKKGNPKAIPFPIPMRNRESLEFSFSGLKTAVVQHVKTHGKPATEQALADLCASMQHVLVESLVRKSIAACRKLDVHRLVLTGGVAANQGLRERAQAAAAAQHIQLFVPPISSCTDNAAMIAYAGALKFKNGHTDSTDLGVYSRNTSGQYSWT